MENKRIELNIDSSKGGNGAVIAAGSVVNKNIAPNEIWGGVPAKKIGERKII